MTLRTRLSLQIAAMLAGVVLLGVAGVVGVGALRADLDVSLRANEQLRHLFSVGARVAAARALVERSPAAAAEAAGELDRAADLLQTFALVGSRDAWIDGTGATAAEAATALRAASASLRASDRDPLAAFAAPYARLADAVAATRGAVVRRQAIADAKQRWAVIALATLAAGVAGGAIAVGAMLYRGVLRPLGEVQRATARIAAGQFAARADTRGDEEFAALARDFNRMAADLQALYGDLEDRIAAKGRELAQSERLASVGFLAAGVAHEINNPLGIIAGHSERALMRLARQSGPSGAEAAAESLRIICDEAFRCKRITDGLLTLARPDEQEPRSAVALDRLVTDVVSAATAMPTFAARHASVHADAGADWRVHASEARLRQVLLNLTLNALEATDAHGGRVRVRLSRCNDAILAVDFEDDGRGMASESIGRVFEPFYTERRPDEVGRVGSGVGLGLSIAYAIITSLGGTIQARSDGLGRGSTFTVRLPAMAEAIARQT